MKKRSVLTILLCIVGLMLVHAEDGYKLWLRYTPITNSKLVTSYRSVFNNIKIAGNSPTIAAVKAELQLALPVMLDKKISFSSQVLPGSNVIIGTPYSSIFIHEIIPDLGNLGNEGFIIRSLKIHDKSYLLVTANSDIGVLYGVFHLLRLVQTQQDITNIDVVSKPSLQLRLLNHWDNLNRSVERGYAGNSIWNWHTLPGYIDQRYIDYARVNASIGINGTVLTNVNANALVLTKEYIIKAAALADAFRPYGLKVYLTARFSAPIEIGGLKTADPLDTAVQRWWKNKADEIYKLIPDFGGFLVKANSEGQPGPQNYGRTHADGANMLADALAPHNGIVMWRAFVYSNETPDDRFKQAYNEFQPLDGKLKNNVLIQVKNGPIDFQPREPFHPLFGAMPNTPLMMEFQLTQEYLGFSTHLVYEAPLFKECLNSDTYEKGENSTVAKVIDGSLDNHSLSGMAGVANIGSDRDWCGHPFAQANWYTLGRLSWNLNLSSEQIADEWLRQTFTNDSRFIIPIKDMMLNSRETLVNYMTPLGLHHIMGYGHHYGPAPWYDKAPRADWNPTYFHNANASGIGFDRTKTGSNALAQYKPEVQKEYENMNSCPEKFLLWFHHVNWNYTMKSGQSLWNELCYKYYTGAKEVGTMQQTWSNTKGLIDNERFNQVSQLLAIQQQEAVWWRNACVLYFQTFSKMPLPNGYEQPEHDLNYYEQLQFPYAPGNN